MAITIHNNPLSPESLLTKPFVNDALKKSLQKAGIIIMPFEHYEKISFPVFPQGTERILRYFKKHLHKQLIDICIQNQDYVELAFASAQVQLGKFYVKKGAAKAFAGVLGAYVFDQYVLGENFKPNVLIHQNSVGKESSSTQHISLLSGKKFLENKQVLFSVDLCTAQNNLLHLEYQGPAKNLDTVLIKLMEYE